MERDQTMKAIITSLWHLEASGRYDVEGYLCALAHQTAQLAYFYGHLVKDCDVAGTVYHVRHRPKAHQLAYFQLGRGFPHELMDGHFCYVYKDFGTKMLVIPCVSRKTSSKAAGFLTLDIQVILRGKKTVSRLLLSDMRTVDLQRLDVRKPFGAVLTSQESIRGFVRSRLL